jgi:hypothetical protein
LRAAKRPTTEFPFLLADVRSTWRLSSQIRPVKTYFEKGVIDLRSRCRRPEVLARQVLMCGATPNGWQIVTGVVTQLPLLTSLAKNRERSGITP